LTSIDAAGGRAFRYDAVGPGGKAVRDVVRAADEATALRRLAADGLTVTRISPADETGRPAQNRGLKPSERLLVMRQLALMLDAGVSLLESLETIASGVAAEGGRRQFEAVMASLKQGQSFGDALEAHAPGFSFYVYAMARVGEASGRLGQVMRAAADQMEHEDRLRRDVVNALTYPAFLACAGLAAVTFIFVEIVPRFSAIIGGDTSKMPWMSRAVLGVGGFVNANLLPIGAGLAVLVAAAAALLSRPDMRPRIYAAARRAPLVGRLLRLREIAAWARLTAFGLANGLDLLQVAVLTRKATPPGPLRSGLEAFETDLKSGVTVDAALGRHTGLEAIDLSLLRAGQKSGTLPAMFGFLADRYDSDLRDAVKRMTALLEPMAVGLIAVMVGIIALSLVTALSSIYDVVQ
jgi:general secretion pathway protein F